MFSILVLRKCISLVHFFISSFSLDFSFLVVPLSISFHVSFLFLVILVCSFVFHPPLLLLALLFVKLFLSVIGFLVCVCGDDLIDRISKLNSLKSLFSCFLLLQSTILFAEEKKLKVISRREAF